MNVSKSFLKALTLDIFHRSCSNKCKVKPTYKTTRAFERLKRTQERFQVDDGKPVYLKAGLRDQILFQASVLGVLVGLILSLQVIYNLSFAKHSLSWGPRKRVVANKEEDDDDDDDDD